MGNKRVLSCLLAVVMMVMTVLPYGGTGQADAKAKKITLNKKKLTLKVGKTFKLKVKGTKKKVVWKSSKKKVATVNKKGLVRAKKKGTAKITAKVAGKKLKCTVTVKKKTTSKTTKKPEATKNPGTAAATQAPTAVPTPTPDLTEETEGMVFSKKAGVYDKGFDLTIEAEPGTEIYYTTDGSVPTTSSTKYAGSIAIENRNGKPNVLASEENVKKMNINGSGYDYVPSADEVAKCTVLRILTVGADGTKKTVTKTYFVGNDVKNKYKGAHVMSMVIDPKDLLDPETGIHVLGNIYDEWKTGDGKGIAGTNAYWSYEGNYTQKGKKWERPAVISYLNTETGNFEFTEGVGVRLHGGASRMYGQKSFNLYFREDYGNKNLKYALIPGDVDAEGNQIEKYKSFMLRNGGNDTELSKIRDVFNQDCLTGRAYGVQAATPCVLFLNGEYWGLYNLTEKYSNKSIENNYGVKDDNVVIFKEGELDEGEDGDEALYGDLWSYAEKDFTDNAVYEDFCEIMDIDSFADFYATEIYIANQDFNPEKNYEIWRSRNVEENNPYGDTKWRYLLYDTEYSMGLYGSSNANTNSFSTVLKDDALFAAVMKNKDFQEKFLTALKEIGSENFDPYTCAMKLKDYYALYRPLLSDFFLRFYGPGDWRNLNQLDSQVDSILGFVTNRYNYIVPRVEKWCESN